MLRWICRLLAQAVEPDLTYKDHRISVTSVGNGWRAMIYAPGSNTALPDCPASLEYCLREAIVVEAKRIVDGRCTVSR